MLSGSPQRVPAVATLLVVLALLASTGSSFAASPVTGAKQPSWAQLSAAQKQFLAPLADNWDALPGDTRRKLVGIAQRQSTMSAEQKDRVQSRLAEWTQLSKEERDLARRNYQQLSRLPTEQRQDVAKRWQQANAPGSGPTPAATEPAQARP